MFIIIILPQVREAEGVHNQSKVEALYEHWEALERK